MGNMPTYPRQYRWIGDYNKIHLLHTNLELNPEFVVGNSIMYDRNNRKTIKRMYKKLESRLRDTEFLRSFEEERVVLVPDKYDLDMPRGGQETDAVYKVRVRKDKGQIDFLVENIYENLAKEVRNRGVQEYLKRLERLKGRVIPAKLALPQWSHFKISESGYKDPMGFRYKRFRNAEEETFFHAEFTLPTSRTTLVFNGLTHKREFDSQDISLKFMMYEGSPSDDPLFSSTKIGELEFVGMDDK